MALGGGTFLTTNKILPGTYINFVSSQAATINLSDRGFAAAGFELNWGKSNEIITITAESLQKDSLVLLGYDYTAEELRNIREVFTGGAKTLYAYRLNGSGLKAYNTYCTAKYAGTRGNDLKTVITANGSNWDVETFLGNRSIDLQTVKTYADLKSNEFVDFNMQDAVLEATTGLQLAGGTNSSVSGGSHQAFLDLIESYGFNTLGCASVEPETIGLYKTYTLRMRDSIGKKFQCVSMYVDGLQSQDYEGVITLKNTIINGVKSGYELIYWLTGAEAGCAVNRSCANKQYDGEYSINTQFTQVELESELQSGHLVFHSQNNTVRILRDINSLITYSVDKGKDFSLNQVIRVLDQSANDIASTFASQFYGIVPNDEAGRISLWSAIVSYYKTLQQLRAIEGFDSEHVTIAADDNNRANVIVNSRVRPTVAMEYLYITTIVE